MVFICLLYYNSLFILFYSFICHAIFIILCVTRYDAKCIIYFYNILLFRIYIIFYTLYYIIYIDYIVKYVILIR